LRGPWKVKEICKLCEFGDFLCSPLCIYSVLVYIKVWDGFLRLLTSAWGVILALPAAEVLLKVYHAALLPFFSNRSSMERANSISHWLHFFLRGKGVALRQHHPLPPPATLQVHPNPHCLLLQLLGFCCCCCCCCCFCCEVQMQAHLMLPPTPPELQLCPHMPLSWRGLHPHWCKHLGPPHRPLNWGRAGCNAGCNGCSCHIRPEADDELPSGTIGATSVRFRLVKIVMFAP